MTLVSPVGSGGLAEEILGQALDLLVRSGRVRYIGASDCTAWQLIQALGTAYRLGLPRFVSQEIYYRLQAREPIPLAVDQAKTARDRLSLADLPLLGPHTG